MNSECGSPAYRQLSAVPLEECWSCSLSYSSVISALPFNHSFQMGKNMFQVEVGKKNQ